MNQLNLNMMALFDVYGVEAVMNVAYLNLNRYADYALVHLYLNVRHHYHQLHPAMIHGFAHSNREEFFCWKVYFIAIVNMKTEDNS